jgi:hypothetical protein
VKVQATVVLEDPDLGPLSVLVEAEVELVAPGHHRFGPAKVRGTTWAAGGRRALLDDGSLTLRGCAQDLVDSDTAGRGHGWTVWNALVMEYDRQAEAA